MDFFNCYHNLEEVKDTFACEENISWDFVNKELDIFPIYREAMKNHKVRFHQAMVYRTPDTIYTIYNILKKSYPNIKLMKFKETTSDYWVERMLNIAVGKDPIVFGRCKDGRVLTTIKQWLEEYGRNCIYFIIE